MEARGLKFIRRVRSNGHLPQSRVSYHRGMSSEENSDGMEKIMEKEGKTKTITESDVDNWHLEMRTNNVSLDEYTVGERMKNLSYLEKKQQWKNSDL